MVSLFFRADIDSRRSRVVHGNMLM